MKKGDSIKCITDGLTSFNVHKDMWYTVSSCGEGPLCMLIGPTISLEGFPDTLFFSAQAFELPDHEWVDNLIKSL